MRPVSDLVKDALTAAASRRHIFLRTCFERSFTAFHALMKFYAVGEYRHAPNKTRAIALYHEFFAGSVGVAQGLKDVPMYRRQGEISGQLQTAIANLESERQKAKSMNVILRKLTSHSRVPSMQLFDNYLASMMRDGTDRAIMLQPLEAVFASERRTHPLVPGDLSHLPSRRDATPFRNCVDALRNGDFDLARLGCDTALLRDIAA